MTTNGKQDQPDGLPLPGLDGTNPLGFLAALGTLRALTHAWPQREVKIAWRQERGTWRPVLHAGAASHDDVVAALHDRCQMTHQHSTLHMADNLSIDASEFRKHLCKQAERGDSEETSFAAAFGCDAIYDKDGIIADTSLRTMSGAGHQHFLKTMRDVLIGVTTSQINQAIFWPWGYDDPLKGLSLRFDPVDEKCYAIRWDDPSGDPTRNKRGSMHGANALAILGIPFLVVAPVRGELHTTGFWGQFSRDCRWSWPIWNSPLNLGVVASMLAMGELQEDTPNSQHLGNRGVVAAYRSQRITTGKFRNFTPAQRIA